MGKEVVESATDWSFEELIERFSRSDFEDDLAAAEEERRAILDRFPLDEWPEMPLERYALGQEDVDEPYCWWLEWNSYNLGSIGGGSSMKHLIFKRKSGDGWYFPDQFDDRDEAWEAIRGAFVEAFELASEGRLDAVEDIELLRSAGALTAKSLFVYFPELLLPSYSKRHLRHFLDRLGRGDAYSRSDGTVRLNQLLLETLREYPELDEWSPAELGELLYAWDDPEGRKTAEKASTDTSNRSAAARWDDFVDWSAQVLAWDEFEEQERGYKLEIAENVALALEQLREGEPWKPALDLAFGSPNNLLYWRTCDDLKTWFASSPEEAREAVLSLVDEEDPVEDRLDAFFEVLSDEELAGPSVHVSVASYFLMGADPARYVFYQYTAFKDAMELAGYEQPAKNADETQTYLHILTFLDELEQAVVERGAEPRDLLDMQSVVWVLTKTSLEELDFLSDEELRELASLRGESLPGDVEVPEGELVPPFAEVFTDMAEAEWAFRLFRETARMLGAEGPDDKRLVVSMGYKGKHRTIALNFADWGLVFLRAKSYPKHRLLLALPEDVEDEFGYESVFEMKQSDDELAVNLYQLPTSEFRPTEGALLDAYERGLEVAAQRFRNYSTSIRRHQNVDELLESVFDPAMRKKVLTQGLAPEEQNPPFDVDRAMDGLFLDRAKYVEILKLLKERQNLILQGPPGVGKTFMVKRLAYTLMGEKAPERVKMVQFHQSYTYEDFIQGYRPTNEAGFQRTDGTFYEFCERAKTDSDNDYVFIIDEINRGNLSKIFGELMMLIEPDKRGDEWQVPLQYAQDQDETFFVPKNVYLIGMMNTADRSLAMVDYALRRRFAFVDLEPQFNGKFSAYLREAGVEESVVARIVNRMQALNEEIAEERTALGPGFRIGHSYFVPRDTADDWDDWYRRVIKYEIAPLLEEYWFDDHDRVEQQRQMLTAGV